MTAAPEVLRVLGGVDTHADTIHVAAIDEHGRELGDREFCTSPAGYRDALAFLVGFGALVVIGIEGTSSYGAGITRLAAAAGIGVREVTRPDRSERRMQGKSDPIDAYQAARAVLAGRADAVPKTQEVDAVRALTRLWRCAGRLTITAGTANVDHPISTIGSTSPTSPGCGDANLRTRGVSLPQTTKNSPVSIRTCGSFSP